MAIRSNQNHWIYGNPEERMLILATMAAIFLAFVFEHVWH